MSPHRREVAYEVSLKCVYFSLTFQLIGSLCKRMMRAELIAVTLLCTEEEQGKDASTVWKLWGIVSVNNSFSCI